MLSFLWCEGADWIQLTQERVQYGDVLRKVVKKSVPLNEVNFLTTS